MGLHTNASDDPALASAHPGPRRRRAQVEAWQARQREKASSQGFVTTILGRRRLLPDARNSRNRAAQAHALRAAINTPIQGSAADIATAAMLRINEDDTLRRLGWRLLLQVCAAGGARDGSWERLFGSCRLRQ
jgi:hypothetical protein